MIAGVSQATVGRVIGDYGYVHPETRAKVIAVVKELGFNPNVV